jgi:uracil-DNA glycosylase
MVTYSTRVVRAFSSCGNPSVLLVGEAPGPRGANRTGYPFWGDDAGIEVYGLIGELGLLDELFSPWIPGASPVGESPPAGRYAITNACTQMPVGDDGRFCAPTASRLDGEAQRLLEEIRALKPRAILTCGKSSAYTLAKAAILEGSTPPAPLARSLSSIKLEQAMTALLNQANVQWRVGGSLAFVTAHPARNQWSPTKNLGRLHAIVVERLRQAVSAADEGTRRI